ncbi:MAG: hypothetical protein FJ224_12590 [Lentisphaerae bacterium]|nr:hypothetical protein [Lentisphaerota bacterium]
MKFLSTFLALALAVAISLKALPWPFVWIFLAGFVFCLFSAAAFKGRLLRRLALSAGSVCLLCAAVEAAMGGLERAAQKRSAEHGRRSDGNFYGNILPHEVLGFAPRPGSSLWQEAYDGDRLIYGAVYTIGPDGLRVSAPSFPGWAPTLGSVLFFGCSFMFGETVNDDETLPTVTGALAGWKYAIHNFAFHGYGPHHMLAALQGGVVERVVKLPPRCAVYLAIPHHVARVAGKATWSLRDPRYRLEPGGVVARAGRFGDAWSGWSRVWLRYQSRKSAFVRFLSSRERRVTGADAALLVGVVDEARRAFEARYPGAEFHVIVWDEPHALMPGIIAGLRAHGVRVHLASDILTGFAEHLDRFMTPGDSHPNAATYRDLAEYVAGEILGARQAAAGPGRGE